MCDVKVSVVMTGQRKNFFIPLRDLNSGLVPIPWPLQ